MDLVVAHAESCLVSNLSTATQFWEEKAPYTAICIFCALKGGSFIHRKRFGCPRGVKTIVTAVQKMYFAACLMSLFYDFDC